MRNAQALLAEPQWTEASDASIYSNDSPSAEWSDADEPRLTGRKRSSGGESPSGDSDTSSSAATEPRPDRKIWMRGCHNCGDELHVRRTRCTGCGAQQTSKKARAAADALAVAAETRREVEAAAPLLAAIRSVPSSAMPPPPRLSADLMQKLVRMRKLRLLLANKPRAACDAADMAMLRVGQMAALPVGADAFSMLAAVACAGGEGAAKAS